MPTMTPEQIAMKLYTSGTFHSPIVAHGDLMRDVMVAGINADRAQRPAPPTDAVERIRAYLDLLEKHWPHVEAADWRHSDEEGTLELFVADLRAVVGR